MARVIQLITKGDTEQISSVEAGAGRVANTLIIKAQSGVKYELRDAATKFAPQQLLVIRQGKDLWIKFEDDEKEDELNTTDAPDIIIEDYYEDSSGSLIGLSEDGQYYNYAPQEGNSDLYSVNMDDGEFSYQSLGYSDVTGGISWVPLVLGALFLGGLAVALSDDDDDNVPDDGPTIDTVEPGAPGTDDDAVVEGENLVYTVTLSGSTTTDTTYSFNLGGGTATQGDDYNTTPVFSDGVVDNGDGTITVPAGVSSFTVTVPTIDDTLYEPGPNETVPLTVGGVTGTGEIIDNDSEPTIDTVTVTNTGEQAIEGDDLVYAVTMSNPSSTDTTFSFGLGGGSATAVDDYGTPVFSDGVTDNGDGTITVPAGVTNFTITVPTVDDAIDEPDETLPLSVGGVGATGTIVDNDGVVVNSVEPGLPGPGDDAVVEGNDLVYTVELSGPGATDITFAFSLGGGSATAGDDYGTPLFSDGVTDNGDGTITVPAGVSSFTVTVPTVDDTLYEPGANETVPLTVGGVTGTGEIIDNDSEPTIDTVTVTNTGEEATEGDDLVYEVTLSNPSSTDTTFSFDLGTGGTATAVDDYGTPTFSNGVTYDSGTGEITVPAGVTDFTVTVPTVDDAIDEPDETVPLSVGGVDATGTIVDNDGAPTIDTVTVTNTGEEATEGDDLVYEVTLSNPSSTDTTFSFDLGTGGTATAVDDYGDPVFSDGVTYDSGTGEITVPAGVTDFTVTVPTVDDAIDEPDETVPLSVGGVDATGTIVDNDGTPTIDTVTVTNTGEEATEGDDLVYEVTLSNPSSTDTTFSFDLGTGGTATAVDDYGTPTFSNGVTYDSGTGEITVPAGVTDFTVTVPTVDDAIDEPDETVPLSVGGVDATGTIVDNDGTPTIDTVTVTNTGEEATEGDDLVYEVTLSNPSSTDTTFSFDLGTGGTATAVDDYGTPTFSNGVTYDSGTGEITVPAGVTDFTVTVPTVDDAIDEPDETVPLSVGGVDATGTIVDNDGTPTIDTVTVTNTGEEATEGDDLVYEVTLSNPSSTDTTFSFDLGTGGTATAVDDYGDPVFSDGVTYDSGTGEITVPAGVTDFTVTVPTVDDAIDEPDETVPLSVGGVDATGTIVDNDGSPVLDLDADDSTATGANYLTTFAESGAAVSIGDTDVLITDVDDTNIESATITLTNAQAGDILDASAVAGLTTNVDTSTPGVITVTLSGSASLADYETAIEAVTFSNPDSGLDATNRTVTVVVNDGANDSNTATTTIAINTITNDAPVLDLDADNSTATGADFATTFAELGGAISIGDTDVLITDADDTNIESATITLTNAQTGDVMAAGTMPAGITASVAGNVVTLSGSASLADYQTAIEAVTFNNPNDNPDTTPRTVTVVVNDGDDDSNTATTTITINVTPIIVDATANVSEEGLPGAVSDTTGTPTDTTNAATVSGTMSITDASGVDSVAVSGPAGLTSGGVAVTWSGSFVGDTYTLTGMAGATPVATLTLDTAGAYTFTLIEPFDHPVADAEDILALGFSVTAADIHSNVSSPGTLTINVEDDMPLAAPEKTFVMETQPDTAEGSLVVSYGADGGYVSEISFDGMVFTYDKDANSVSSSGSSSSINGASFSTISHELTINTTQGETFMVDMHTGEYSYAALGTEEQVGPEVNVNPSASLLGIANAEALGLIDIGTNQLFTATDANNDIEEVVIEAASLSVSLLGHYELAWSTAMAAEFGLSVAYADDYNPPLDITQTYSRLTITSLGGGPIDNLQLNEFLATVYVEQIGIVPSILPTLSITATDSLGYSDTDTEQDVLGLSLLAPDSSPANIVEGTGSGETLNGGTEDDRIYGYDGDDTLNGGEGNDLLRGGEGNDVLTGAAGNDILVGGSGNDTLSGGSGNDTFIWEEGDEGSAGSPATDTITDFNKQPVSGGGDILKLGGMLQGELARGNTVGNLTDYLAFAPSGGNTILYISTTGGFSGGFNFELLTNRSYLTG